MTSLAGAVQAVGSDDFLDTFQGTSSASVMPRLSGHDSSVRTAYRREKSAASLRTNNLELVDLPAESILYTSAKRALDAVGSLCGLVVLLPLFALVAVLTKLTDGGPVFYPHTRVGKWGREFKCFKFRTMVVNADEIKDEIAHLNTHDDHRTFKVPQDPRVTRLGRLLRRASIDEVPQLWNVLRGEMSLVGPRPPVPGEVERYDLDDLQRLMVKPGLT